MLEADRLLPDLEDPRGDRDDVARVELALVFDVLLDARIPIFSARRREGVRRIAFRSCQVASSNFAT